jgi:hypothetical protein
MSPSTKREVSHDLRKIEPRQRRSSRLNRKHQGSHSTKSSTSTEAKMPKIVESSSSTEKPKMETLYSSNKSYPKIIKVMNIVRIVKIQINNHLKFPFESHQAYPLELKRCLMQLTYVMILIH